MIFSPSRRRDTLHVVLAVAVSILLIAYRASIEVVEPMRRFFQPYTGLPIVEIVTNLLFLWVVVLLMLIFRNWRSAVLREKEMQRVISSINPDVFMVISPDRRIIMCNDSVTTMFGYTTEEVLNQATDLLYFDRRETGRSGEIFDCLQQFGFHVGLATGRRKNGQTFPLEIITGDLCGQPGAVLLIRDITERKQAEDALRASHSELDQALRELKATQQQVVQQERLRVLGKMSSYIAHEFNNALTPILGFSELLISNPDILDERDTALAYINDVRTAAEDAAAVIKRLSDFYRHKSPLVDSAIDLNEAIREAISICRPKWQVEAQATNRCIDIVTDLGDLPAINHNREEMHEILTNLIFNSVDAMPDGGVITVTTRADGPNVVLSVSDTGTGMSRNEMDRCFEPFFTRKGSAGTGLGLAVIGSIVKRWKGDIQVSSTPGEGTTFTIVMPKSDAPIPPKTPIRDGEGVAQTLNILVVDDDPRVAKVIEQYLLADGHGVTKTEQPGKALQLVKDNSYGLVITDWAMPEMSGSRLAAHVKQHAPAVPVILMTGVDSDLRTRELDGSSGIDLIIKKPVTRQILRKAMLRVMARYPSAATEGAD